MPNPSPSLSSGLPKTPTFQRKTLISFDERVEKDRAEKEKHVLELLGIEDDEPLPVSAQYDQNVDIDEEGNVKNVGFGDHFKYAGTLSRGKFFDDKGVYKFADGSRFEGKMVNGQFDGKGKHYFNNGVFRGVWDKGRVVSGNYVYNDSLVYVDDDDWEYCNSKTDRRYVEEFVHGIGPAGKLKLTGHEFDRVLPTGCYDAGDGFLDLETGKILDYNTKEVVRDPDEIEKEFIRTKSRAEASIFLS